MTRRIGPAAPADAAPPVPAGRLVLLGPAGRPAARAQPDARHGIVRPRSPKGAAGPKPTDRPVRHAAGRPKVAWAPARRIR